jgi:tetratricopeptide (TPR) repeat protein
MLKLFRFALFILFTLLWQVGRNQINMPQPSPLGTVTQKVGLADITITYSRPSAKGRVIFGELVPFDKLWRTGANAATKIKISEDVTLEGNKVPAGEYALLTIPGRSEWIIILNKDLRVTGEANYKPAEDLLRFKVKPQKTGSKIETFTIQFADLTYNSCYIELQWENTMARFKLETEVDSKVMADIENKLINPTSMYYQAARYYYENNKDLKQALEWINKATEKQQQYWVMYLKAKIQAANGDYKGALETAEIAKKLAAEAKNDEYVKMNEAIITEYKRK